MAALLEKTSTITAKGRTTIPKAVRQALGVGQGDRIAFRVDQHGVTLHRADAEDDDPAIERFLDFLARDVERRPEAIVGLSPALAARIANLTEGIAFDPAAPIDGEVTP